MHDDSVISAESRGKKSVYLRIAISRSRDRHYRAWKLHDNNRNSSQQYNIILYILIVYGRGFRRATSNNNKLDCAHDTPDRIIFSY